MTMLAFLARVAPLYLGALALTGVGALAAGDRLSAGWIIPLALLAMVEFAALLTFRRERWGWAVLLAFSLTAGALLQLLVTPWRPGWTLVLAASVAWPSIVIPLGWKTGAGLRRLGWVTWTGAWFYILSWIALRWIIGRTTAQAAWGVAGFVIFSALTLTWSAALPMRPANEPAGSIAAEIYLIGMNLSLAATMLLRS